MCRTVNRVIHVISDLNPESVRGALPTPRNDNIYEAWLLLRPLTYFYLRGKQRYHFSGFSNTDTG